MATTITASVVTAFNEDGQNFYDITFPGTNLYQNHIASVSKADPAVVTTSVATVISTTGTVGTIAGTGPYTATITNMTTTAGLTTGMLITATDGVGGIGNGTVYITSIVGNKSITIKTEGGTTPTAGTITNISIAAPYTIGGLVDGDAILITDVGGMTQLATAGVNGTNQFYANVLSSTTFSLYTNEGLTETVDSTGFTTATANTGSYQTFTGSQYVSQGSQIPLIFTNLETTIGSDISVDVSSGEITLAADVTYQIIVTCQPLNNPASQGGTYALLDIGAGQIVGESSPINGTTLVATVTPSTENTYQVLAIAPNSTEWVPPAGVQFATLSVVAISGYSVA